MKIQRTSVLSGKTRTLDLDVTEEQIQLWQEGALIQNVMPQLNVDEREFLINGVWGDEWNHFLGEEEDV